MGKVRIFLPLVFALCVLRSYGKDIDLSTLCNTAKPVIISTADHLVVGDNLHVEECRVTVQSDWRAGEGHPNRNWLMILIQVLNMPCREGTTMQFFNGSTTSNDMIISWPSTICSDNPYQTWYLIKNKMMEIIISAAPDRHFLNMKLLVTATSFELEQNVDNFVCDNQLHIVGSLKCDGDNNCGDFSDEVADDCRYTKKAYKKLKTSQTGLSIGLALAVLSAIGVSIWSIKRKRNAPDEKKLLGGKQGNENA